MKRKVVNLSETPEAAQDLPLSHAVVVGDLVFTSGWVGYELDTSDVPEGIQAQTEQTLENLKAVLEVAGTTLDRVVKVTVYLKNVGDFRAMNQVYRRYFPKDPPARTTIGAGALVDPALLVEIEMVAALPDFHVA